MTDLLSAPHVASLVAPVVDRLRLSIHRATQGCVADVTREHGLDQSMSAVIGNLRNVAPGSPIARASILSVYVYQDTSVIDRKIDGLVEAGLLTDLGDGQVRLTEVGLGLIAHIHTCTENAVRVLWSGHEDRVTALADVVDRAARSAMTDGGPACMVMAPVGEPAGATVPALLAERLTALRFHRFDAHVAAWTTAGMTADQIKNLPPGPTRNAIELDTNRRAATPYVVLDPAERLILLAGLGALPG